MIIQHPEHDARTESPNTPDLIEFIDGLHERAVYSDQIDDMELDLLEPVSESEELLTVALIGASLIPMAMQVIAQSDTFKSILRWKEAAMGNIFARVVWDQKDRLIRIRGVNFQNLLKRTDELYKDQGFQRIFIRSHKFFKSLFYNMKLKKKLTVEDVSGLSFHHFFALEAARLFEELANKYGFEFYRNITAQLWTKTWLREYSGDNDVAPLDLGPLSNLRYTLKDYQRDFVSQYPVLKHRLHLRGVILSFDQGLGKTLTVTALAECLHKRRVYIVCPNTLRDVWGAELRKYFPRYDDEALARREIFVYGTSGQTYAGPECRFVITNNESITKIFDTIKDARGEDSMLILDEGHNFRNLKGSRTAELIELRERIGCDDVIPMSGTPIKAKPNEIVPALLLIDKLFDMEAAVMYNKLFDVDDTSTREIVQERFGRIIHRKRKVDVIDLPRKHELTLALYLKDSDPYLLENLTPRINSRFLEIYAEKMKDLGANRERYGRYVERFSTASPGLTRNYLMWVRSFASQNRSAEYDGSWHELTVEQMEEYAAKYVIPNVPREFLKEFRALHDQVILMRRSAMGVAIGEILPVARTQMFLDLWEENKERIKDMIRKHPKKTVIFSIFLDVVKKIHADLAEEFGAVLVTGDVTSTRSEVISRFKEDDDVQAIVATSQTLSTGVTLTEASQMFFFGTPWRSADRDQASDRIHRIGQTSEVYIYNAILGTTKANLSTRMEEILRWSERMFDSMIDNDEGGRMFRPTMTEATWDSELDLWVPASPSRGVLAEGGTDDGSEVMLYEAGGIFSWLKRSITGIDSSILDDLRKEIDDMETDVQKRNMILFLDKLTREVRSYTDDVSPGVSLAKGTGAAILTGAALTGGVGVGGVALGAGVYAITRVIKAINKANGTAQDYLDALRLLKAEVQAKQVVVDPKYQYGKNAVRS